MLTVTMLTPPVHPHGLTMVEARGVAPALAPGAVPAEGGFRLPLDGTLTLARGFDPPPQSWLPGHRGVDLMAGKGAVVRASGDGVVRFAGPVAGRGVVSIDHQNGLRTTYEPVTATVPVGATVRLGDPVGVLAAGHPGCPAAACLHWGLRHGEEYLDPLALLGRTRVRLLPRLDPPHSAMAAIRVARPMPAAGHYARGWAWRYAVRRRSTDTWV